MTPEHLELLRTLAHDLKTPLANLRWQAQLLARSVRDGRIDQQALLNGLQAISLYANEAAAAIDEVHDLTRLEAGAPILLQRRTIDLAEFVRQVVEARVESTQQRLEFDDEVAPLSVDVDPQRLSRALGNVLDNAIKYSRPASVIRVTVGREEREGVEFAAVRVQDEGIGIPASDLPFVFERNMRGSNVAQVPGEGLGLASVRNLVQLHGGQVGVDSRQGVGSTFTILLPLEQPARVTAAA